jgi:hypothetical protein
MYSLTGCCTWEILTAVTVWQEFTDVPEGHISPIFRVNEKAQWTEILSELYRCACPALAPLTTLSNGTWSMSVTFLLCTGDVQLKSHLGDRTFWGFRHFPQSLQINTRMVREIRPRSLPSKSFRYLLILL